MSSMSTRSTTKKQLAKKKGKPAPKPKPPTLGDRVTRIEAAIEKVAAMQAAQIIPDEQEPRGRKTNKKQPPQTHQRRSVSLDLPVRSHSPFNIHQEQDLFDLSQPAIIQNRARLPDDVNPPDAHARQTVRHDLQTATQQIDLNTNNRRHLDPHPDVNKNTPWGAWLANSDRHSSSTYGNNTASRPYSYSSSNLPQDDVEAQVQQIIATTAHSLSKGNNKPEPYPFKYVARGPERRKLPINTVSLAEHLWGILRMVKDKRLDQCLVPFLLKHLEDVIEDACDFEWSRVRRWLEEIFSLVSENRLESVSLVPCIRLKISKLRSASNQGIITTKNIRMCRLFKIPLGADHRAQHITT